MERSDFIELKVLCQWALGQYMKRQSECIGKEGFTNRVDAAHVMRSRRMKGACTMYRCRFCNLWHVGSELHARKRRKAIRSRYRERKEEAA